MKYFVTKNLAISFVSNYRVSQLFLNNVRLLGTYFRGSFQRNKSRNSCLVLMLHACMDSHFKVTCNLHFLQQKLMIVLRVNWRIFDDFHWHWNFKNCFFVGQMNKEDDEKWLRELTKRTEDSFSELMPINWPKAVSSSSSLQHCIIGSFWKQFITIRNMEKYLLQVFQYL